jgi:hypothetical protein
LFDSALKALDVALFGFDDFAPLDSRRLPLLATLANSC